MGGWRKIKEYWQDDAYLLCHSLSFIQLHILASVFASLKKRRLRRMSQRLTLIAISGLDWIGMVSGGVKYRAAHAANKSFSFIINLFYFSWDVINICGLEWIASWKRFRAPFGANFFYRTSDVSCRVLSQQIRMAPTNLSLVKFGYMFVLIWIFGQCSHTLNPLNLMFVTIPCTNVVLRCCSCCSLWENYSQLFQLAFAHSN